MRAVLLGAQVALCAILLTGTALLARAVDRVRHVDHRVPTRARHRDVDRSGRQRSQRRAGARAPRDAGRPDRGAAASRVGDARRDHPVRRQRQDHVGSVATHQGARRPRAQRGLRQLLRDTADPAGGRARLHAQGPGPHGHRHRERSGRRAAVAGREPARQDAAACTPGTGDRSGPRSRHPRHRIGSRAVRLGRLRRRSRRLRHDPAVG